MLPSWHCFECVLFVVLVGTDCLVLGFLNDFFIHAASVNLWSHSPDLPADFIAPSHQFIFFGLAPHLPGPHFPLPMFLSFSLSLFLFFFFFAISAYCQFGGHALAVLTGSPRRSKRLQNLPHPSIILSLKLFFCYLKNRSFLRSSGFEVVEK